MKTNDNHKSSFQTGFTLIELMVGLTIGMIVSVVIMQVFSVFETQKRTTTGTADAQINGNIALFSMEREIKLAGWPLMPDTTPALKCNNLTIAGVVNQPISSLSPVSVLDGGAASDSFTIHYGDTQMGGVAAPITAMVGNAATVVNSFGCNLNDATLVINGTTCAMSSSTAVTGAGVVPASITLKDATNAVVGANLMCLGTWNTVTFGVVNGNLVRNGVPIVAGIVDMQVQYGISAIASNNQIVQWVDATGATWTTPLVDDRNRIKAIRVAVVARNAKLEPAAVTAGCSSLVAASPTGLCAWEGTVASPAPNLTVAANVPNFAQYRYRVFETIIPLRNVIWARSVL